ncbi:MAG: phosphoribosylanthranilate isomerase [Gammaproteobacteria bacterium]|mgnify:CR=1 FL=1|nr:phosphoribosylanthranilate isomerase [Gammaproteobacteria bacterium]MDP6165485.1 phosphoribosylanthranilate isomerase [Gammaproteobacteria bacterium]
MRTRVKICGLRHNDDVVAAAKAGADAMGFVFYSKSPRAVSIEHAAGLVASVPSFITRVGLFVNASAATIEQTLKQVPLTLLQFHGDESPEFCQQFGMPWIKAVRMHNDVDLVQFKENYHQAQALLLDAYKKGVPGGTGAKFDWQRIPQSIAPGIILAGGLAPENVANAITQVRPWAVDVSGGVESSKGIKDHAKIEAFMASVKATY